MHPHRNPVWYKTWWGVLLAIFFILSVFLLIWADWAKPRWIKIEVSNCNVALVTVVFTYVFFLSLRARPRIVKIIFGVIWLLLLPNTAYLFTDVGHIPYQWNHTVSPTGRILLLVQYLLLELFAVITFLLSFLPFEEVIQRVPVFKRRKVAWLILFNFIVGYGVVLGRFEHINSQVVFTNPLKVLASAIHIFLSLDLLGLTILFGLLCNVIYFLFRSLLLPRIKGYSRLLV